MCYVGDDGNISTTCHITRHISPISRLHPDDRKTYTVAKENVEFWRGRKDGMWYLICESNFDQNEAEPYSIELANELISATQQTAGVEGIREEV